MHVNYAIVFVSDMRKSIEFYRDVMGMTLRFESPGWTEFATDGATLALHKAEGPAGPSQSVESAGHCRPGLRVANIDEFHQRMMDRGVPCIQPPTNAFGARIAQYVDPDGLAISVSSRP